MRNRVTFPAKRLRRQPAVPIWVVRRRPGGRLHEGLLQAGTDVFACVIGRSGMTAKKREGDGATPRGDLRVVAGYWRRDRLPLMRLMAGYAPIRSDLGWCDDPLHPAYNQPIRLPFSASHERMLRHDRLYDVCLVLDWNLAPRVRGRGSAIFLHIAPEDNGPTAGCVALEPRIMDRLLRRLRPGTVLRVLA